jgi:hypothetical protein
VDELAAVKQDVREIGESVGAVTLLLSLLNKRQRLPHPFGSRRARQGEQEEPIDRT